MQKAVVTQLLFIAKDTHGESSLLFGVDILYMDVSFSMFAVTEANRTVFFSIIIKCKPAPDCFEL